MVGTVSQGRQRRTLCGVVILVIGWGYCAVCYRAVENARSSQDWILRTTSYCTVSTSCRMPLLLVRLRGRHCSV